MSDVLHPLRVVIAGPPDSGKLTALHSLLSKVPPKRRGKLIPKKLGEDIVLSIDIRLGSSDADRPLRLMTVQAGAGGSRTWRTLLRRVDGVVFVGDARPGQLKANQQAHRMVVEVLKGWNHSPDGIAWVYAWNRRDEADKTSAKELSSALNSLGLAEFETVATSGYGLFQAFKSLFEQLIERNIRPEPAQEQNEVVSEEKPESEKPVAEEPVTPTASFPQRNNTYGLAASFTRSMQNRPMAAKNEAADEPDPEEAEQPADETPTEPERDTIEQPEAVVESEAGETSAGDDKHDSHEEPEAESGLVGLDPSPFSKPVDLSKEEEETEEEEKMPDSSAAPEEKPSDSEQPSDSRFPAPEGPKKSSGGPSFFFPETRREPGKPMGGIEKPEEPGDPTAPSWKKLLSRHKRN